MPDTTISALPVAAALTGTELIPAVQSSVTVRTTPAAIAQYAGATAIINIRNYGAKCDGVTDDSAAWQAAINAAQAVPNVSGTPLSVVLSAGGTGQSVVLSTLNMTNFVTPVATVVTVDCSGCCILGQTNGKPVIDAMGAKNIRWVHLSIKGMPTLTPSVGIQIGRMGFVGGSSFAPASQFYFDHPTIEGFFTFTPFYNRASEVTSFIFPRFTNDQISATSTYGMVNDGYGYWVSNGTITSAFVNLYGSVLTGASISTTTLTEGSVTGTALATGDAIFGPGVTAGTVITGGSSPTWTVNNSQTVASNTLYGSVMRANSFIGDTYVGGVIVCNNTTVTTPPSASIWMGDTSMHRFLSTYINSTALNNVVLYYAGGSVLGTNSNLSFECHMEGATVNSPFFITGAQAVPILGGFRYVDSKPFANTSIFQIDSGSSVTSVTLQDCDIRFAPGGAPLWDTPANYNVSGHITLATGGNWAAPASFSGQLTLAGLSTFYNTGPPSLLAQSAVASPLTHTGDTTETNLAAVVVPAGYLGASGGVRVKALWYRNATTTNSVKFIIRLGGTSGAITGFLILSQGVASSGTVSYATESIFWNTATGAQLGDIGTGGLGASSSAPNTGTQATTNIQYINFNVQNVTSGSDTCGLYAYTVEAL
jgi:hypothetical protein